MMFFDLRTVTGFKKAFMCTCCFPLFDAIVLGDTYFACECNTTPPPIYIGIYKSQAGTERTQVEHRKDQRQKLENKYGVAVCTACTLYVKDCQRLGS